MWRKTEISITIFILLCIARQSASMEILADFHKCLNECQEWSHLCISIAVSEGTLEDFQRCSLKMCQKRCRNFYFIRRSS